MVWEGELREWATHRLCLVLPDVEEFVELCLVLDSLTQSHCCQKGQGMVPGSLGGIADCTSLRMNASALNYGQFFAKAIYVDIQQLA